MQVNFALDLKLEMAKTSLQVKAIQLKLVVKMEWSQLEKISPDDGLYERKETAAEKFMFNLKAGNHQIIGTSQSYTTASGRDNGIESVKKNAPDAIVDDQT